MCVTYYKKYIIDTRLRAWVLLKKQFVLVLFTQYVQSYY